MAYGSRQKQVRAYRGQIPSPGRPTIAWREDRVRFWAAIATGVLTDEASARPGMDWWLGATIGGMLDRIDRFAMGLHDGRLTTMGTYNRLFVDWQPKPIEAPILLLRSARPLRGTVVDPDGRADWRAYWPVPHDVVDIPGDHFTALEEHSDSTAAAVREWVAGLES